MRNFLSLVFIYLFSFFSAGKSRDELGREVIDPIMVNKGPREGAREVNERSPQHSPKRMGASIHR